MSLPPMSPPPRSPPGPLRRLWGAWMEQVHRPVDSRPFALVRISACLCLVVDLVRVAALGLVPHLFHTYEQGGLSKFQDPGWVAGDYLGTEAGPLLFWFTLASFVLTMLGLGGRLNVLLGVLAYAQLGHLYSTGDRGIDRALRCLLLIVAVSPVFYRLSLGPLIGRARFAVSRWMPAWPELLIRWLLVLIYLSAGTAKLIQQPGWLSVQGTPVLYRILTDPMAGVVDPVWAEGLPWLWRLGGWATIAFELSAPLLLTPWRRWWALCGVGLHIGIAATMDLGMFSWGMLSFYFVLLSPWVVALLDRLGIGAPAAVEPPAP